MYVAVKGGEKAIKSSIDLLEQKRKHISANQDIQISQLIERSIFGYAEDQRRKHKSES